MPKTCIICGNRAGSGEHTFPAALGGRRTNRGIYCNPHDQGFSPLVSVISYQLKTINSLLKVRPDRKEAAEAFEYVSPEGERLTIFDGVVGRTDPSAAFDENQMHVRMNLGGPVGLRAIAYITLTFFAQYFQFHARKPGLKPLKDFVTTETENNFVWWESEDTIAQLPQNDFAFGHTIALQTSAATGKATALVSLFQSMNFGIQLGDLDGLSDENVIVFIDPHAERPPHDIKMNRQEGVIFDLQKPEPLHTHLEKMIKDGGGSQVLQRLMNKIQRWKFDKDIEPYVYRLNDSRVLAPADRIRVVSVIVEEQTPRVFRLMQHLAKDFKLKNSSNIHMMPMIKAIDAMVEIDKKQGNLTEFADIATTKSMIAILKALISHRGVYDNDMMWKLFNTGYGLGIVGKEMFGTVKQYLGGQIKS